MDIDLSLLHSKTVEKVDISNTYNIPKEYFENSLKNENTLDILGFLWENIVLEVPLQFTKVRDLSKFHGDGWKLISEDDLVKNDNPFNELLKDFKEE